MITSRYMSVLMSDKAYRPAGFVPVHKTALRENYDIPVPVLI